MYIGRGPLDLYFRYMHCELEQSEIMVKIETVSWRRIIIFSVTILASVKRFIICVSLDEVEILVKMKLFTCPRNQIKSSVTMLASIGFSFQ